MGLTPKERKKIYEEEKARIEAERKVAPETEAGPSTSIKPNTAGLLCYLGIWVTGIIFLIIERKNRIVRFHAMQSLVTFGILCLVMAIANTVRSWIIVSDPGWNWLFYPQLIAANVVFGVFMVITIVLWIVLMYQTYHGRLLNLSLFGHMAQKLLAKLDGIKETDLSRELIYTKTKTQKQPAPPTKPGLEAHFEGNRASRVAASVAAIVWSAIFLVFFNFFSRYLAIYSREVVDGITHWQIYPLLTPEFSLVLPILNVTLILTIVGHSIAIARDKYLTRQIILIVLSTLGMITVITFLRVFPFDFSVVPHAGLASTAPTVTVVVLILITVGLGISALVKFIKLIINLARERDYPSPTPPA